MPSVPAYGARVAAQLAFDFSDRESCEPWAWSGAHFFGPHEDEGRLAAIVVADEPAGPPTTPLSVPHVRIPEELGRIACGRTVRVRIAARSVGSRRLAAAYVVEGGEPVEWTEFPVTGEWTECCFEVAVSDKSTHHHLALCGDLDGQNRAVLVRRIEIDFSMPWRKPKQNKGFIEGFNLADGVINELRAWSYDRLFKDCDVPSARMGLDWVARLRNDRTSRDSWLGREDAYVAVLLGFVLDRLAKEVPGAGAVAGARRRVVISIPVWGESFIRCLTEVLIPSLLADGNVPALARQAKVVVYILTAGRNVEEIAAHPACQQLARHAHVEILPIDQDLLDPITDDPEDGRRYWLYGAMHQLTLAYAKELGADLFLLNPDTIYSRNALGGLYGLGEQGYDAVVFTSLRLKREAALEQFRRYADADGAIALDGTDLANVGIEFVHPVHRACFMHPENRNFLPRMVNLYWEVPGAVVMHAAHQQPHFLSHRALARLSGLDYNTVDTRLISRMFATEADWERLLVLPDMRDIAYFELTPETRTWPLSGKPFPMDGFARSWYWPACEPINDWIFRKRTVMPLENQPYIGLRSSESMEADERVLFASIDDARDGKERAPREPARLPADPPLSRPPCSLDDGPPAAPAPQGSGDGPDDPAVDPLDRAEQAAVAGRYDEAAALAVAIAGAALNGEALRLSCRWLVLAGRYDTLFDTVWPFVEALVPHADPAQRTLWRAELSVLADLSQPRADAARLGAFAVRLEAAPAAAVALPAVAGGIADGPLAPAAAYAAQGHVDWAAALVGRVYGWLAPAGFTRLLDWAALAGTGAAALRDVLLPAHEALALATAEPAARRRAADTLDLLARRFEDRGDRATAQACGRSAQRLAPTRATRAAPAATPAANRRRPGKAKD